MTIEDIKEAFASQGDKSDFPYEIDPDGFMSWLQGYGIDYQKTPEEGNKFIERLPFNMLMFLITSYMIDLKNKMPSKEDVSNKLDKTEYEADKPFFVTTNTAQSITGLKTFNVTPQAINNPVNANDLVRLAYLTSVGGVGLGFKQKWINVTNQRQKNVNYTNNTGKPIMVIVNYNSALGSSYAQLYVDDLSICYNRIMEYDVRPNNPICVGIVPSGSTYRSNGNAGLNFWCELR